ncbi:hypothetical protein C922_05551 [Plasmodium inui San Antonio 1]|uniref:Uncharacterized protein n=1 Tax=Plasmodium inui San Antonio 1 TaxID=1237626 RepID=W6ZXT9_9APIC|nr:hypothetical protein C922_05551 [Plasmodium inui San Antonio 1]EUD64070.1 hypothetical protein C922_05551 [Plasmodium inui San Antonio 1]
MYKEIERKELFMNTNKCFIKGKTAPNKNSRKTRLTSHQQGEGTATGIPEYKGKIGEDMHFRIQQKAEKASASETGKGYDYMGNRSIRTPRTTRRGNSRDYEQTARDSANTPRERLQNQQDSPGIRDKREHGSNKKKVLRRTGKRRKTHPRTTKKESKGQVRLCKEGQISGSIMRED